jgi:hypothetical protein
VFPSYRLVKAAIPGLRRIGSGGVLTLTSHEKAALVGAGGVLLVWVLAGVIMIAGKTRMHSASPLCGAYVGIRARCSAARPAHCARDCVLGRVRYFHSSARSQSHGFGLL